jgi:hypothetical protein
LYEIFYKVRDVPCGARRADPGLMKYFGKPRPQWMNRPGRLNAAGLR